MNTITEIQNATRKGASTLHNDCISRFKMIRAENWENAIVGTLERNSFSSKFDELKLMVIGLFDILIITETTFDDSFPEVEFFIDSFSMPYMSDRNRNEGGHTIYIREGISSNMLTKHNLLENKEAGFIELNFRKCKWLFCARYRPPSQNRTYFSLNIDTGLDVCSTYERVAVANDFNEQLVEILFDSLLY